MARERDLFANFERMRREMDELFGEVERRLLPSRRAGFQPAVDIFYEPDPARAIVCVELAGVDPATVELQITGRELTVQGRREMAPGSARRAYQQLEIEQGSFCRIIELGADVDSDATRATYERGILRIELPLRSGTGDGNGGASG